MRVTANLRSAVDNPNPAHSRMPQFGLTDHLVVLLNQRFGLFRVLDTGYIRPKLAEALPLALRTTCQQRQRQRSLLSQRGVDAA
jgi:hypothetical protein